MNGYLVLCNISDGHCDHDSDILRAEYSGIIHPTIEEARKELEEAETFFHAWICEA